MLHYDDDKKNKIIKYIKDGIINIIVIGISLAYILFQQISITTTAVNLITVLGKSALGILCGILIKQGLGENGFTKGYNSPIWKEELEKYNATCNTANEYMERVDNFYYYEEIEKRKKNRRAILMGVRLKYSDFFDDEEEFIGQDKMEGLNKIQKKAVNRCVKIKIYNLNLFSEYSSATTSDTHKEKTDASQRAKMAGKNSLSAAFVAIAGAYFIPIIDGWNWGNFIFATLQVCMWSASGVMQSLTNANYVTVDKVNKLKRKKELIQKFVFGCKQGMYKNNPYELREQKKKAKAEELAKKQIEEQIKEVGEADLGLPVAPKINEPKKAIEVIKEKAKEPKMPTEEEIQYFSTLIPGTKEYDEMVLKFS